MIVEKINGLSVNEPAVIYAKQRPQKVNPLGHIWGYKQVPSDHDKDDTVDMLKQGRKLCQVFAQKVLFQKQEDTVV